MKYEEPKMEFVVFEKEDVIATSLDSTGDGSDERNVSDMFD